MRDFTDDLRDVRRRVTEAHTYLRIDDARERLVALEADSREQDWNARDRGRGQARRRKAGRRPPGREEGGGDLADAPRRSGPRRTRNAAGREGRPPPHPPPTLQTGHHTPNPHPRM